jgi:hypothetical protein
LWAGLRLILATMNGLSTSGFPREIGTFTSLFGGAALLAAVWLGISVWRARRAWGENGDDMVCCAHDDYH